MINKNKDALPIIHHKDLKQLSDMIDNAVYLYDKGWTKEELKRFIDKYCLESVDEKLTVNTAEDQIIVSVTHPMKEEEPVASEEEEEEFMDEEGETPAEGEGEGGDNKPTESGDASKEQDTGSE